MLRREVTRKSFLSVYYQCIPIYPLLYILLPTLYLLSRCYLDTKENRCKFWIFCSVISVILFLVGKNIGVEWPRGRNVANVRKVLHKSFLILLCILRHTNGSFSLHLWEPFLMIKYVIKYTTQLVFEIWNFQYFMVEILNLF